MEINKQNIKQIYKWQNSVKTQKESLAIIAQNIKLMEDLAGNLAVDNVTKSCKKIKKLFDEIKMICQVIGMNFIEEINVQEIYSMLCNFEYGDENCNYNDEDKYGEEFKNLRAMIEQHDLYNRNIENFWESSMC